MASTNTTSIGFELQSSAAAFNDDSTFQLLPVTSSSLTSNLSTATSEVIRADRQTDDLTVTDSEISGDIGFEFSYDPWKDFMISLLQGPAETNISSVTGITTVAADNTLDATGVGTGRAVGDPIYLSSSTEQTLNGAYVITEITSTDLIEVTPAPTVGCTDAVIRAVDEYKNGAETPDNYQFKIEYTNDAGTPYYFYYRGCQISSANLNFSTGSILNGSISIVGLQELARTEELDTGASAVITTENADTAIVDYNLLNSVTSIGAISVGGVSLGTCSFSSMDLTVDNNINQAKSIGVLGACSLASFALQVTGNIEIYFNNLDAYTKFKNADSFSVSVAMVDNTGDDALPANTNMFGMSMKKCKFETLSHPVTGKDAFLMESGSFRALRDSTNDSMIEFTYSDSA